jgi:hypothetical protein
MATSITTRSGKGSPLTNAEVDANFTSLNTNKIEKDGSIVFDNVLTIRDVVLNSPLSGDLDITGNVNIIGNLTSSSSSSDLSTESLTITLFGGSYGASAQSEADGAGLEVGDTGVVRLTYDDSLDAWKTYNLSGTPLNFAAGDFKVLDTDNVTELFSLVDVKDAVYGTDLTTTYATQNSVTNGDTLKEAVEAIDAEDIPTIKTDLSSVVSDVSTINTNLYSVIHLFEEVTSGNSLASVSGTHYFITPASGETGGDIDITLPSANKGRVTFTLEDNTNGNLIITPVGGDTVGSGVGTDDLTIDKVSTISFAYISSSSEWKIISNSI